MYILKELVRIVSPFKIRGAKVLGQPKDSSHIDQLYMMVHTGQINEEEEIGKHFFSDNDRKEKYSRNLKNRLHGRLINNLFLIDIDKKSSNIQKATFNCWKNYAAVQILQAFGARKAFVPIAERTLARAQQYRLTEIVFSLSRILRKHYGEIIGDVKKYRYYANIAESFRGQLQAEDTADFYLSDVLLEFANSRNIKRKEADRIDGILDTLSGFLEQYDSIRIKHIYFRLEMIRHQVYSDHHRVISTTMKALEYFGSLSVDVPVGLPFVFHFNSIPHYILLNNFDAAIKSIVTCQNIVSDFSYNFYVVNVYKAMLGFHNRDYRQTEEALERVGNISNIPWQNIQEQWRIIAAYNSFFTHEKFRLGKFLNEVPVFSKDKCGNNINILILQVLFLLRKRRYGEIIDRMEALRQYSQQHLRRNETFRSNCFIKMLCQLPNANFHKLAVIRKANPYFNKLQTMPLSEAQQGSELELIPYEMLWEEILGLLDEKVHRPKVVWVAK